MKRATWNGDELTVISFYDWPQPHTVTDKLRKVRLTSPAATYFCAVDGQCYGLESLSPGTCIAIAEQGLQAAGARATYVTFGLKDRSDGAVTRWIKKWSKRTSPTDRPDYFDASVRFSRA